MEDIILLVAGIVIFVLVVLLLRKSTAGKNEFQKVEMIVEGYFIELLEETEKLHRAYLEDLNFLQKKVNELEKQIKQIQQAKQIDIKIDQNSTISLQQKRAKSAYQQTYNHEIENEYNNEMESKKDEKEQFTGSIATDTGIDPITQSNVQENDTSISSKVIALHQQGLSTEEIAKRLNMMCGEVQLMVGLFRRKSEV